MKIGIRKYFWIVLFIFFQVSISLGQRVLQNDAHRVYDIGQRIQTFLERIRTSRDLEQLPHYLENRDILDNLRISNLDTVHSKLIDVFKDASNNSCVKDLIYTAENINLKDLANSWSLKMLDSFGKPESGFLTGNLNWLGDFSECRNIYAPKQIAQNATDVGGFHGKYCTLQASLVYFNVSVGVCVPETCDGSDFLSSYLKLLLNSKSNTSLAETNSFIQSVTCKPTSRKLNGATIATICVISFFIIMALIGSSITAVKYFFSKNSRKNSACESEGNREVKIGYNDMEKQTDDHSDDILLFSEGSRTKLSVCIEKCEPFFNCFCVFTNGSKLLNTDATEGQLLCLHGIRFLSMSWVILCHTYVFPVKMMRSMLGLLDKIDNFPFQVILNGFYSVDSFFVLSGFLMAYLYFQEAAKRKGSTPWLYFYIHRYLRLTPVYMIVLGFYTTAFLYFGSGPFWADYDIEPVCQKNWWWNALYINNFQSSTEQCMGWAWYLANDMQFFAISPLILITIWRWPKIGYSILALLFCGTWIASFVITYHYNLVPGALSNVRDIAKDPNFTPRFIEYFDKVYTKPYTRIGPYLVGIALAYNLFKRRLTNRKVTNTTLYIGWILATAVGLTCIYGLYHNNVSLVGASFYNTLSRTAYAICLSWVIFVCLTGQGGAVDKILSYKLFIPLSRLTYCAYLIHPIVQYGYFQSLQSTIYFTHTTMVIIFLGLILVTYALALVVSLILESPVIRLEKFVRSKFQSS